MAIEWKLKQKYLNDQPLGTIKAKPRTQGKTKFRRKVDASRKHLLPAQKQMVMVVNGNGKKSWREEA